jgi:hypothetical protein
MEELEDGLQFCRIRKAELRQQAKRLRKVHLRDCLLDAQSKHQNERAKAIKFKLHREESKQMWYLIKRTEKDPHSPSVLKVQRVVKGKIEEYTVQEDVEQAIQQECKVRFLLAHRAPIMNSLLGEKLRYLSDEALATAIITGTYDIPTSLDPATAMILKEIGKLGMKIVNGDSNEIVISPEDFKRFWKKVNEFTSSSMSGVHYGHYKAAIQDPQSTNALALQLTIIARSGIPPESWSVGLQVMLEKNCRSMPGGKTKSHTTVRGGFQLLQPVHFWQAGDANAHRQRIHPRRIVQPEREYRRGCKIRQNSHGGSIPAS